MVYITSFFFTYPRRFGAVGRLHEPEGRRPAGDCDLFRQKSPGPASRQLRAAGRPDLRLHQPYHPDLGPGAQLPDAAVQAAQLQLGAQPRGLAPRGFVLTVSPLSAPAPPAATAPRCW